MESNSGAVRPKSTSLEYYRKSAKALLKAAKAGEQTAVARMAQYGSEQEWALHTAQLTIAREQGFASWPRFRAFLVESGMDFEALVTQFVKSSFSDLRSARGMLAQHPELSRAGLYVALVLGDSERVEQALKETPGVVRSKGGPYACEPLVYVCFSRFASAESKRAQDLARTARVLLSYGADANTAYWDERWKENALPCLYGATGLNNNPEMARALLEAGARTDDGESVYHATEHADLVCLKMLLEFGASLERANALKHMLDYEHLEGVRLLLAAGADPNERNAKGWTALHWAVWRGRSAGIVNALLDGGAEIDAKQEDGRTAYALAVRSGQTETAELLKKRGADTELLEVDQFLGKCVAAEGAELERVVEQWPQMRGRVEFHRLLPEFAASHRTEAVRSLLKIGVPLEVRGESGGTALHWACWKGYADVAEMLIEQGASLTVEDSVFHATPVGWFGHGLGNSLERDGDYAAVARLLVKAGAKVERTGVAEVDAVLVQDV